MLRNSLDRPCDEPLAEISDKCNHENGRRVLGQVLVEKLNSLPAPRNAIATSAAAAPITGRIHTKNDPICCAGILAETSVPRRLCATLTHAPGIPAWIGTGTDMQNSAQISMPNNSQSDNQIVRFQIISRLFDACLA